MCKWQIRRKYLAKKVRWGGSYKTSLLSFWVKTISASFTKIFKKLFSHVLETLEFWIIQSILSPHYLSVRLDRCKLTTLIFPSLIELQRRLIEVQTPFIEVGYTRTARQSLGRVWKDQSGTRIASAVRSSARGTCLITRWCCLNTLWTLNIQQR